MAKKFIFLFAGLGLLAALFIPNSTFAWFSARDTDDTQAVTAGHVAVTLDKKFAIVDENGVEITGTNADEAVFMPSMIYIPNSDKTTYTGNPNARYEMKYTLENKSGGAAIVQLNIPGLELSEDGGETKIDSAAFRLYRLDTSHTPSFFRTAKNSFFEDEIYLNDDIKNSKDQSYDGSDLFGNLDLYMLNSLVISTATKGPSIERGTNAATDDLGFRLAAVITKDSGVKLATGTDKTYASAYSANYASPANSVVYLYMPAKASTTFTFRLYRDMAVSKNLSNYYQLCGITLDVSGGLAGVPNVVAYATQTTETAYKSFFPNDHDVIENLLK